MTLFQHQRTVLGLLVLAIVLSVFWLLLPRALGLAVEHWLDIPGLESISVDIDHIGTRQAHLSEVRAVYRSAGGHRFQTALHDIELRYAPEERRVQQLVISRGELAILPGAAAPAAPWPKIEWPSLPLDAVRIDDLQLTLTDHARLNLEWRGSFRMHQAEERVQAEFVTDHGLARLTATPAQELNEPVEIAADWLPNSGPAANARLRIGREPSTQPMTLTGQAALADLATWAKHLGADLPVEVADGMLLVKMKGTPGDVAGTLRTLNGDAEVVAARGRITQASTPPDFAFSGKLGVAWQAASTQIDLKPGLQWRIDAGGGQALQASGRLDSDFWLRYVDGVLLGEDAFPFELNGQVLGRWDGAIQGLRWQRKPADAAGEAGWAAAEMRLRVKGGIDQWRHDAFAVDGTKAEGAMTLRWSPSDGLLGEIAAQAGTERIAWSGHAPIQMGRTTWKVNASAIGRANADFWKTLVLKGEASSPQLNIAFGAGQTLTLGPSRLQLVQFRPGKNQGLPTVEHAEGELLFSTDAVRFGAWPAPGVQTRFRLGNGVLRSEGTLSLQAAEVLQFSGAHRIRRGCGEADVSSHQPLATLAKALQPRPPMLRPLDLRTGEMAGRFALDWCLNPAMKINAKATVQLRDAALGWDQASIEAAQGTLQLDGLNPLRGHVHIAARSGELATGTPLADLEIDLALGVETLAIHALHARLLGGTLRSEPLVVPWPLTNQPIPLEIQGIDLGLLLALPKVEGLSGSGQIDGVLPLVPNAGGIEIHDGQLRCQGSGTLKYAPTLAIPDNPGLQALRNFHFQHLDMRLSYSADGAYRTQTLLEGSNPDFYGGYPIRFGLNINGALPGLFRAALFSGDFNRHILEQLQSGKLE